MTGTDSVEEMWAAFLATCPEAAASTASYSSWHFCDDRPSADELAELARSGRKRATSGALWAYELEKEPLPQVGDLSVITGWEGRARCVIRTTSVEIVPFEAVTREFAAAEGEGDCSLEYWRKVHWAFFARELQGTGREPRLDMPVVCERFDVVFGTEGLETTRRQGKSVTMRLLFTFAGGSGHLEPLIPIARAAEAKGHAVAFAARPWMIPKVEALGFLAFATGSDVGLTPRRLPLAPVDLERDMRAVGDGFGRRIARERAADILPLCAAWRPDLLVCDELDFGAMVVAERLALPHATVLVSAAGSFVRPGLVAEPLNEVRAEHGLPPDPDLAMLSRYLVLSSFPPSYRDPAFALPATAHALRLAVRGAAPGDTGPPWITRLGNAPTVYFTLGTVYNMESGDLFQRVIAGLRDLPIDLVVTVGRDIDPEEFGRQPANVHIERYVRQALLLPHCHLVVSHGGSGSVMGALAHGLPMVLIPMGADQPLNAARGAALGVAQVLDAMSVTPQALGEAVSRVLDDPTCRRNAERIRDEIAALPGPEHGVILLERLATERRAR